MRTHTTGDVLRYLGAREGGWPVIDGNRVRVVKPRRGRVGLDDSIQLCVGYRVEHSTGAARGNLLQRIDPRASMEPAIDAALERLRVEYDRWVGLCRRSAEKRDARAAVAREGRG